MALEKLDVTRDIDNQLRSFGASDLGADEYVSVTFMPFIIR